MIEIKGKFDYAKITTFASSTIVNSMPDMPVGFTPHTSKLTNSLKVMGWKVEVADKSRDGAAYRVYKISK